VKQIDINRVTRVPMILPKYRLEVSLMPHRRIPNWIGNGRTQSVVNPCPSIFLNIYFSFSYLCRHLFCGLFLSIR
jgi:hypothetical protein